MFRVPLRLTLLVCLLAASTVSAQQTRPRIGYIYPAGSRQGAELELIVGGRNLAGVATAYISGSGIDTFAFGYSNPENPPTPAIAETVTVRVTIAADAKPGRRELRLETPAGLSNPLAFHVGQLPEFREAEKRSATSIEEVTDISLPCVVNGQIMPGDIDRYRFKASKGQRLVFTLSARELIPYLPDAVPGWFQAVLALYDAKGNELKFADDFRFHPDPVLAFEVPEDGEYTVAVHDNIFRGREDFVYRLAAGELPFISEIFPLGGKAGEPTNVELRGWHLPETRRVMDFSAPGTYPIFVRKKHDALSERKLDLLIDGGLSTDAASVSSTESVSNRVPFAVDRLPECLEKEPNDSQETPQQVALPIIVNGRIDNAGDWDVFRFDGRAGQEIYAEVNARRLGSPLDSVLRLTDANGKQLAFNDEHEDPGAGLVTHHADSMLHVELPADGAYYIHLGDIQQHGGAEYAYRLRISPPRHDFELRIVPSSINIRGGGTVALAVHALRRDGFNGDIDLALKDAPHGFKLQGAQVPDGQDQVRLTLSAPPMTKKRVVNLALEGRAMVDGQQIVRPVVPAENMMQAFIYWHLVPVNELNAIVSAGAGTNTTVRILDELPIQIPAGGTAAVRMRVPIGRTFDKVHLELDEPPQGITIEKETSDRQGTEIVLKCDAEKAKPGLKGNLIVNAFAVRTEGSSKAKPQPRGRPTPLGMLPAIPFEIVAAE